MSGTTEPSAAASLGLGAAQLTFDDEFNTFTSSVNGYTGWATSMPYSGKAARNFGSGSENYNSDSSVGVNPFSDQNGVLTITAAQSAATLPYGLTYTSGVITSRYLASQQYGFFEAGINVPTATGLWPSFFLLPNTVTYGGELDVAEVLTKNTTQVYNVTHGVTSTGAATASLKVTGVPDLSAGFHTVAADWEPGQITYYVDGVVTAIQTTPTDLNTPMYMVLTMTVGGGFPGYPSSNFTSAGYQIDYVRSYATAATVNVSGSGVIQTGAVAGLVTTSTGAAFSGITVSLVNSINQVVARLVTDSNGYFIFTSLAAGNYRVLYGATGSYVPMVGSQADPVTGLSAVTTVTNGATVTLATEMFAASTLSAVTGTVLFAAVGGTGAAQSGVTVALKNAAGTLIGATTTDSTGKFLFTNLAAGNYTVTYTPLAYDALQAGGPGGSTGTTAVFTTIAGQTTTLAPETLNPAPGSISGTIVYSGSHSEGWAGTGEAGVAVSVVTLTGTVVGSAVTASDGTYTIAGVNAGSYYVQVTPPSGQVVANGFGTDVTTNRTARVTAVAGGGTLAPSVTLINAPAPSISGTVLFNAPGVAAVGNANITVTLLDRTNTNILATVPTDANGAYSFINMEPGAYYLRFTAPSGETFQSGGPVNTSGVAAITLALGGSSLTVAPVTLSGAVGSVSGQVLYAPSSAPGTPDPGITVNLLNGSSTIVQSVQTDGNGNYSFTKLIPGSYSLKFVLPTNQKVQAGGPAFNGGQTSPFTVASGQAVVEPTQTLTLLPGNVSGSVSYAGSGQAGVTVSLIAADGSITAAMTSSSTGAFVFRGITPGSYQVRYTPPSGEAPSADGIADPGTGLTSSFAINSNQTTYLSAETFVTAGSLAGNVLQANGAGAAGVTVSVLNSTGNTVVSTSTAADGSFAFPSLAPGNYQLLYSLPAGEVLQTGPADPDTGLTAMLTVTGGEALSVATETVSTLPATISGSTLFSGTAQAGISVLLLDSTGTVTIASTTTSSTGSFSFTGLAAGTYLVKYAAPSGEVLQSGPGSTSTGLTGALTVAAGQTLTLAAEILAPTPATITGSALLGTAGQAGISVLLLDSTGTATIASTTTSSTGSFSFTGLAAGAYLVKYAAPSGEVLQSGPANTSTGLTGALTVAAGQTLTLAAEILAAATGGITGSVKLDSAGQAGVTVLLLDSSGTATLATTTTNSYGFYGFSGLTPAYYQVQYVAPSGEVIQSGPADPTTGSTVVFGVPAGVTRTIGSVILAPAYATLTGSVLFAGAGQPGVAVALRNGAGAVVATTASDINGAFSFGQLAAGSYALAYTAPAGESFQAGDPADSATGITGAMTLLAGQTYTAPAEHLLLTPVSLTMSGSHVALTKGDGPFIVTGSPGGSALTLGNGDQNVTLGGFFNTVTLGNGNDVVTLTGPGQILHVGNGAQALTLNGNFGVITLGDTPAGQTSTVTANGAGETVTGGNGAITVAVTAGNSTVALGNGNDTVKMIGSRNTVTVGTGNSVIDAGTNSAIVHAAGGNVTVTIAGQSNLVDIGPGNGVINAGASHADTFMLNGANQGLTIINGFSSNGDVLNLARTLTGTAIANDLSNISQYLSSSVSGGNTTLSVIGGSGAPSAFAVLNNTATSISQLVAGHQITTT